MYNQNVAVETILNKLGFSEELYYANPKELSHNQKVAQIELIKEVQKNLPKKWRKTKRPAKKQN